MVQPTTTKNAHNHNKKQQTSKKRASLVKKEKKKDKDKHKAQKDAMTNLKIGIASLFLSLVVAAIGVIVARKRHDMISTKEKEQPTVIDPTKWELGEPRVNFFLGQACKVAYCHDSLKPSKRSFRALKDIEVGETLFEVPRSMQIWDLDALRDPFIRKHLFSATHKMSGNPLGSEAFLAAYLALEMRRAKENYDYYLKDPIRLAYFDVLPTLMELAYHPILINVTEIRDILGRSSSHAVLQSYRNMVVSEYEAFTIASTEFGNFVNQQEYLTARLIVMTRSMRVGPPSPEEVIGGIPLSDELQRQNLLEDELQAYKELIGVDLMNKDYGCVALIPIADLFNHHPNNNVEFRFDRKAAGKGAFVISAEHRKIGQGTEPMASYGVIPDAHLYSRYGFVNGDGSGPTQVTLAFHHEILKLNISSQYDYLPNSGTTKRFRKVQEKGVATYLKHDDGYPHCIVGPSSHPEQWELKRLKYRHLLNIANDIHRWTIQMPPRNHLPLPPETTTTIFTSQQKKDPTSSPTTTTQTQTPSMEVPYYKREEVIEQFNMEELRQTCRIMSMINTDYDGRAVDILRKNLNNPNFIAIKGNDDLEFRSLMCVGRWLGTGLKALEENGDILSEYERVHKLNVHEHGSQNWAAYHVRLGEMQALHAASNIILEQATEHWEDKKDIENVSPEYFMRDVACPDDYLRHLLNTEEDSKEEYLKEFDIF